MSAVTLPQPFVSPAPIPATSPPPTISPSPDLIARLYRLTVRPYDQIIAGAIIGEKERVELIEGSLVAKMGKNRPHI